MLWVILRFRLNKLICWSDLPFLEDEIQGGCGYLVFHSVAKSIDPIQTHWSSYKAPIDSVLKHIEEQSLWSPEEQILYFSSQMKLN